MISTLHDPKNLTSRRRYFLTYSLVFLLLLPLVFFWHLLAGKTLISNGDRITHIEHGKGRVI